MLAFAWLWEHLTFQRGARFKAAVCAVSTAAPGG